jgi:two-component system, OmpR family, sensor histidine kinase SenX3
MVGIVGAVAAGLAVAVVLLALRLHSEGVRRAEAEEERAETTEAVDTMSRTIERIQGALDSHGDGVIVVDAAGDVVFTSREGRRYHGARYADALAEEAVQDVLARARLGEHSTRELPLFGPPQRVLRIHAVPIEIDGEIRGATAFVADVTEARRVEQVRRDFVAAVSHELKTPIGALALLAETMVAAGEPAVMSQLADRIVKEAERLARMVDDLLDLSIIESQEAPRREPVPVNLLVHEALDEVAPQADAGDVPIHLAAIDASSSLVCDRRQVVSAIRNLLENAVKYSEPGEVVDVSVERSDTSLEIVVRDHGVGIPARDMERIFERFYRVDKARSRETGGTGLGLSIVRHVAQAHGGDVAVQSVEGEGSVFRLRFPAPSRSARLSEAS